MTNRKGSDPSPFRSGLVHGLVSLSFFGGIAALLGTGIHLTGDPEAAGPRLALALFEPTGSTSAELKSRFQSDLVLAGERNLASGSEAQSSEPNLGVPDPTGSQTAANGTVADVPVIRINGRDVRAGQSLSQVEQGGARSETVARAEPTEIVAKAEVLSPNARPFQNPDGKPMIGLVIGGLGTSYRQSIAAIEDLPAGVTLSFTPDASPALLRRAREKGHEILVEVPLEAYSTGRTRPHPYTLTANATQDENSSRLRAVLSRKPHAYGVITHNGAKFATNERLGTALMEDLSNRNLAFFQHATLRRAPFAATADRLDLAYAAASENIDNQIDAEAIETQLFKLETKAMEMGMAFGTGFTYPVTVDVVKAWAERLEAKGILLAPASAIAANRQRPVQTTRLETDPDDTLQ
ncbi:MAG: divergent polysaccharide deacetylase family protein [Pseudomonadota bacterium]